MSLHTTYEGDRCCNSFPWPLYTDVRDQAHSFSGVAAYYELLPASIGGTGEPERVWGQSATSNFFDVSQIRMYLGRGFLASEERLPVIVLSHRLWQRRFASDPAILGKAIPLSGHMFTVVGVAPPGFRGLDLILDPEFWVPLGNVEQLAPNVPSRSARDWNWLAVVGRLKPGVTQSQAAAELATLAQRFAKTYPATDKGRGFFMDQAGSLPPEINRRSCSLSRRCPSSCCSSLALPAPTWPISSSANRPVASAKWRCALLSGRRGVSYWGRC